MKTIKFTEEREFDYGDGPVLHKIGDVVSLRDDKAQRWITRGVAYQLTDKEIKAEGKRNDNAMESSADVAGADSGDSGERSVDVPQGDAGAPAPAPARKTAGSRRQ
ncbi:hypothetical protein [Variovorax sp. OAS795]|uniref:hypothetical protein n=1 Tax=Variovorax sp. OAS795 TaxID=3034231 RepID=UPI0033995734